MERGCVGLRETPYARSIVEVCFKKALTVITLLLVIYIVLFHASVRNLVQLGHCNHLNNSSKTYMNFIVIYNKGFNNFHPFLS